MLNEEMRNKMIDEVAEWMADNTEFSTEFLRSHGEDWLTSYSLDDLYRDYYGLGEIFKKYSLPSWEDVACKIEGIASDMICSLYKSRDRLFDIDDDGGDLVSMCRYIVSVNDTAEYLKKTMFCGADESMYGKIIDALDNDNLFGVISADADEYVKGMHVSFEKAIEIVVKEEYLKGRWF